MDPASAAPGGPRLSGADPHDAAVRLSLLGGFQLWVDGAEATLPFGAQRLLALLALRGRMGRSRTAGILWPQATERRALACLRTAIWRVNHVTPELLRVSSVAVDLTAAVDVDVRRLEAAADALADGSLADAAVLGAWRLAPRGDADLLTDWEDDWLVDDRQRLQQLDVHVLELFAARFTDLGRFGLAMEAALMALRSDPLRESAHRAVIRVHLAEGNPVDAKRALDFCRLVLAREAGVEPSGVTTRLVLPHGPLVGSSPVRRSG
jgi:DNA-binding SARP family transcriptional activator